LAANLRQVVLRNGTTAVIYKIHKNQERPIHGAYQGTNGWMPMAWEVDGKWAGEGKNHGLDIYPYDSPIS